MTSCSGAATVAALDGPGVSCLTTAMDAAAESVIIYNKAQAHALWPELRLLIRHRFAMEPNPEQPWKLSVVERDAQILETREAWATARQRWQPAGAPAFGPPLDLATRKAVGEADFFLRHRVWGSIWGASLDDHWSALRDMWTPLLQRMALHGDESAVPAAQLLDALWEIDGRLRYLRAGEGDEVSVFSGGLDVANAGDLLDGRLENLDLLQRILDRAEDAVTAGDRLAGG
jgi:hypothetical protein